jgi:hypothetical protein
MALPLVRQKVTGNTPLWRAGQGRARQRPSATLIAGATNVAPVVRIHSISALEEGPPRQCGKTNTTGTTGRWHNAVRQRLLALVDQGVSEVVDGALATVTLVMFASGAGVVIPSQINFLALALETLQRTIFPLEGTKVRSS